jgi:hypothetical protein
MKSEPGPPMTLGNTAAARVRFIVWCLPFGEPRLRRASRLRREPHGFAGSRTASPGAPSLPPPGRTRYGVPPCRRRWHKCRSRRNVATIRSRDSCSRLARAAGLFSLWEPRYRYGRDRRAATLRFRQRCNHLPPGWPPWRGKADRSTAQSEVAVAGGGSLTGVMVP